MKKHWLFISVWVFVSFWIIANAISYHKDYIGVPYNEFLAKLWWLQLGFLFLVAFGYFLYPSQPRFRQGSSTFKDRIFTPSVKRFFSFSQRKLLVTALLIFGTFLFGALLTLIKSSSYEKALALAFYGLSPEFSAASLFFYDWIDAAFAVSSFSVTLCKWLLLYVLASFYLRRKESKETREGTV